MLDGHVYIGLTFDSIHPAHVKLIRKGLEFGKVKIKLLIDEAIAVISDFHTSIGKAENFLLKLSRC